MTGSGSTKSGNRPEAAQSKLPPSTMMPPMEVPWPPMNLVAEWIDNGGAVVQRSGEVRCGHRVVHHQGNAVAFAEGGDGCQVADIQFGVADGFNEKGFGPLV